MRNPAWLCFGSGGSPAVLPGTAGSGASAQAARPKAFPFSSILIREPSASRPFAELRSRPFRACHRSRPSSDSNPLSVGLAAPSMARHRSLSCRPSLHPPSAYLRPCPCSARARIRFQHPWAAGECNKSPPNLQQALGLIACHKAKVRQFCSKAWAYSRLKSKSPQILQRAMGVWQDSRQKFASPATGLGPIAFHKAKVRQCCSRLWAHGKLQSKSPPILRRLWAYSKIQDNSPLI